MKFSGASLRFFRSHITIFAHHIQTMMSKPAKTYPDFWPTYVRAHRHPWTRRLHFVGTTGALLCGFAALVLLDPWFVVVAFVFGYACAWIGHFLFESNRPPSYGHPLWSFVAAFQMYGLMWMGRMDAEVERLARGE